ncbi:hypothetical protein [Mycoplasma procyoni]|uniref:hypothetical protein n=1 Tax=Mycoplasma procyoni TaxID=568784 RepID=UPI00197B2183|nr:hypothetical protein [Mycoplasma procyoni]MBN3534923.1 hypothetical protein [Mycoplasma procyoni]
MFNSSYNYYNFAAVLHFYCKKQIIRSYKKNYFITGTKELKEITYNRLLITDKKKWVSDIFGLFKKENQIEGSKASDNLSPNPNVDVIITKESAIEKEMYSQNTKDLSTFLIILRPISWIISIVIKPLFLMNKLLFVKEIFQQYGLKIKLQKYIAINWLFFLVLFVAPIITITFLISFGVINTLLWSILPYFIIAIAYALMVAIPKYYLIKNAIIKEL